MFRIKPIALALFVCALAFPAQAHAEGGYVVTLTNGETITANECMPVDSGLRLRYPVGEAFVPLSSVKSVTEGGVPVEFLQQRGERIAGPPAGRTVEETAANHEGSAVPQSTKTAAAPTSRTRSAREAFPAPTSRWNEGKWKLPERKPPSGDGSYAQGSAFRPASSYEADIVVGQAELLSDEELMLAIDRLFDEPGKGPDTGKPDSDEP